MATEYKSDKKILSKIEFEKQVLKSTQYGQNDLICDQTRQVNEKNVGVSSRDGALSLFLFSADDQYGIIIVNWSKIFINT